MVGAADSGIINRALLSMEEGLPALRALGEPDIKSRSQEYDGRRLVRVNHGYIVLNFMRYRDRDTTAAARAQRYRDRLRLRNLEVVKGTSSELTGQAEKVLLACSISDKRLVAIVAGAIEAHVKGHGWTAEKTAARMIEGYQAYTAAAQELRFTVSARKFFAQGWWLDSKLWPFEKQRRII
jgi:hypothetical protein